MADSIRVDTASLISGSLTVGDAGHGVLGADVPALSYFVDRVDLPADAGKEFRGLITRWPPVGAFVPAEDGTYTYVGIDTDFDYQLYIDGIASGAPVTVPLTTGGIKPLAGAAAAQATAAASLSKQVHLSGDAGAVATAAMAGAGFDSIRVDLDSLISGAIVVGDLGHGVLGSQIPVPIGGEPPSFLWNDIDPVADANKEIRGHVTRWAADGELYVYEDGSFTYLGTTSTDFDYQLYVDGLAIGDPVLVSISIDSSMLGDATAQASATGALSVGKRLSGSAAGQAAATGSLDKAVSLAGAAAGLAGATGSLDEAGFLGGAAAGQATASGALSHGVPLQGAASGRANATGRFGEEANLSGRAQGVAKAGGVLVGTYVPEFILVGRSRITTTLVGRSRIAME